MHNILYNLIIHNGMASLKLVCPYATACSIQWQPNSCSWRFQLRKFRSRAVQKLAVFFVSQIIGSMLEEASQLYWVQYIIWLLNTATENILNLRDKSSFYWHRTNTVNLKVKFLADWQFEALAKTLTPYSHLQEMDLEAWRRKLKGEQLNTVCEPRRS